MIVAVVVGFDYSFHCFTFVVVNLLCLKYILYIGVCQEGSLIILEFFLIYLLLPIVVVLFVMSSIIHISAGLSIAFSKKTKKK